MGKKKQSKKKDLSLKRIAYRQSVKNGGIKKASEVKKEIDKNTKKEITEVAKESTALFFAHNNQLGPPYRILVDTNFINFTIQYKLDMVEAMMDCLFAKCIPVILDSVIAEIEKLGPKYRLALRIAKDPRFERIPTDSEYTDDEIVKIVTAHKCYLVATCDRDLKRRIRKIPGVPIMTIAKRKYAVERMPEAYGMKEYGGL
jgi:U3 small nucleolar RNA-associated protein 24